MRMSSVVVDPHAWLPDRVDRDVVYSRNSSHALILLRARRASRTFIDTLWLSWDLGPGYDPDGENASRIVSTIAEEARSGRPFPIGNIIVLTHNAERQHQAYDALQPWYDVDIGSPDTYTLYPRRPRARPLVDLAPIERLRRAGVRIEPALSDAELESIQARFGFTFSAPHRALLQEGLPVSVLPSRYGWPNWRHGDPEQLNARIQRATDNIFNKSAFRDRVSAPELIPLFSTRYLPSGGDAERSPVFSAHEADVIYCASDIPKWIALDFEGGTWSAPRLDPEDRIPFWSDLAERS